MGLLKEGKMQNLQYYNKLMYNLCKICKHFNHTLGICEKRHKPSQLIKEFFEKASKERICEDYDRKEG